MNTLTKIIAASSVILGLAAAPVVAQMAEDWDAGAWDTDGVEGLSEDEFGTGFTEYGTYGEWDADDDGALSEDEFNAGVYNGYDVDDDKVLSPSEYGPLQGDLGEEGLFDF